MRIQYIKYRLKHPTPEIKLALFVLLMIHFLEILNPWAGTMAGLAYSIYLMEVAYQRMR